MIARSIAYPVAFALSLVLSTINSGQAATFTFGNEVASGTLDDYEIAPSITSAFAFGFLDTLLLSGGPEAIDGLFDVDGGVDADGTAFATLTVFEVTSSVTDGFDLFLSGTLLAASPVSDGVELVFHELVGEGAALFGEFAGLRLADPTFPGFAALSASAWSGFGEAGLFQVSPAITDPAPAPVPLPATGLFFIAGLAGFGLLRLRARPRT